MIRNENITKLIKNGHGARGGSISIVPIILPVSGLLHKFFIIENNERIGFDFKEYLTSKSVIDDKMFLEFDGISWTELNLRLVLKHTDRRIPDTIRFQAGCISKELSSLYDVQQETFEKQMFEVVKNCANELLSLLSIYNKSGAPQFFEHFDFEFQETEIGNVLAELAHSRKALYREFTEETVNELTDVAQILSNSNKKKGEVELYLFYTSGVNEPSTRITYPQTDCRFENMDHVLRRAWCDTRAIKLAILVAAFTWNYLKNREKVEKKIYFDSSHPRTVKELFSAFPVKKIQKPSFTDQHNNSSQ